MAANSLFPAFVMINYHSSWGTHKQIIPTTTWTPPNILFPLHGSFATWNSGAYDASTMINNLVDKFAAIAGDNIGWDFATIYTLATPTSLPLPQHIITLAQVGLVTPFSPDAIAMQQTYKMFDTEFATVNLVLLDMENTLGVAKVSYGALNSAHKAIIDEFTGDGRGWSSRNGARPNVLRSATNKRNDKLRKEYKLS